MDDSFDALSAVQVGNYSLQSGGQIFFIVGPCVIESEDLAMQVAREVARVSDSHGIPMIYKSSFDKANRTSVNSYRGPGLEKGLRILAAVKQATGLPLLSDIHTPDQAPVVAQVLDVIQIPAFLSRQTDLLVAAGRAGRAVNIKKGQFQSPDDMEYAVRKLLSTGNRRILLTERGSTFGYQDLIADMRSIVRMKRFGFPVIFDATHSAQLPGRGEGRSGGDRSLVPHLARAAVGAGADGIFLEVHPDPDNALCDGPNSLALEDLEALALNLVEIHRLVRSVPSSASRTAAGPLEESSEPSLEERLAKIRLIILDVDGVLTDGSIILGSGELEIKSFHVRDGHGIKIASRCGLEFAMVTGRTSEVVPKRASELGISRVYQSVWDKKPVLAELMSELGLQQEQVAVIGDDVVDIPVFRRCGVAFTVPEAPEEVRKEADYTSRHAGGRGAVREIVEMILKAQGRWIGAMARYYE